MSKNDERLQQLEADMSVTENRWYTARAIAKKAQRDSDELFEKYQAALLSWTTFLRVLRENERDSQ